MSYSHCWLLILVLGFFFDCRYWQYFQPSVEVAQQSEGESVPPLPCYQEVGHLPFVEVRLMRNQNDCELGRTPPQALRIYREIVVTGYLSDGQCNHTQLPGLFRGTAPSVTFFATLSDRQLRLWIASRPSANVRPQNSHFSIP